MRRLIWLLVNFPETGLAASRLDVRSVRARHGGLATGLAAVGNLRPVAGHRRLAASRLDQLRVVHAHPAVAKVPLARRLRRLYHLRVVHAHPVGDGGGSCRPNDEPKSGFRGRLLDDAEDRGVDHQAIRVLVLKEVVRHLLGAAILLVQGHHLLLKKGSACQEVGNHFCVGVQTFLFAPGAEKGGKSRVVLSSHNAERGHPPVKARPSPRSLH